MLDENDVLFSERSFDFFSLLRAFFGVEGSGSGEGSGAFSGTTTGVGDFLVNFIDVLETAWSVFVVFSWLISAVLVFGLIYAYLRAGHYSQLQHEEVLLQERLYQELYGSRANNKRWDEVVEHIGSDNPRDWRLAIIEADIMLEEILEAAGYAGSTIGEKLKSASPQHFTTLDQAWSAHLVRNKIAHGGTDFVLTKKIAQDTITQFKVVFEEHDAI